ncbi:MAG: HlyC/CorC family transporter [Saprospiraceae bacterium]|nr:HlyC/CorC family transporter [Saprospiraceae bacterium]MBK7737877.1 HlyC/CorC family transporter [Saprospiraceae bacterium]MBK7913544.1 HlyC/CorC family transporter [Saprospiraceae bacterium]
MTFILIIIFLLITALFAGAEIAFITANKLAVEIRRSRGSGSGSILARFFEHPDDFIATLLVGINISIVVLSYLITDFLTAPIGLVTESPGIRIFLNTFLVTLIILILGEFIPKAFFRLYSNQFLQVTAYPLLFFYWLLYLPAKLLSGIAGFVIRKILKQEDSKSRPRFSLIDLENYLHGPIKVSEDDVDTDIFKNALNLRQIRVIECMVPRTEMVYVDVNDPLEELVKAFTDSNLSRIIVVDGDIDNVMGYIHHQQLFKNPTDIRSIVMDMPFVPETQNVYDLMLRMNKLRLSIACVVDEFGGTSGIITLEDILEEIFGEIEDEHDQEEFIEQQISEREYLFSGRLELQYLENEFDIKLPEGEYHTLSGYLVTTTGSIPTQGSEIESDGYKFIFEMVSDTKIEMVRMIRLD